VCIEILPWQGSEILEGPSKEEQHPERRLTNPLVEEICIISPSPLRLLILSHALSPPILPLDVSMQSIDEYLGGSDIERPIDEGNLHQIISQHRCLGYFARCCNRRNLGRDKDFTYCPQLDRP
jgi:hypothetical protein